jgi:SAM-dependent methyltransferase
MTTSNEREYVLGTGDAELDRLGLQHSVWRGDAVEAWQIARFRPGSTILDVGCGPGFAALDLADLVRPGGHVIAIDQSQRFLDHLNEQCRARGVTNVTTVHADLTSFAFDDLRADGAWLRWVLAFVPDPRAVLARLAGALSPRACIAIHEYYAYETWKLVPTDPVHESFVTAVMASWRERGGEPNVALQIVPWLDDLGFELVRSRTITELVTPDQQRWYWPATFAQIGLDRLVSLGDVTSDAAQLMRASIDAMWSRGTAMVTPGVLELIARKR